MAKIIYTLVHGIIGWGIVFFIFINYGLLMAIIGFFGVGIIMNFIELFIIALIEEYV